MNKMSRKIDNRKFLSYLLQYLNVEDLKQICRDFNIKGYSKLKKSELIEFVLDSLSEEEIRDLIHQKEMDIITDGINIALKKIKGEDRERINNIKIVNPDYHEIEILFKGMNWETKSYLSITEKNIQNPERDCDCRIGSNMGFCNHFWVGFIFSLKKQWFDLDDWNLTILPDDFKQNLEDIELIINEEENAKPTFSLIDTGSENFHLIENIDKSITIYQGEIINLEEKQQDFQGNITTYYIVNLNDVRLGPKIQKKSDFHEEDIVNVESINLRVSDKLQQENDLKPGDKVKCNGKLTKDTFLRMFIVKNIRNIEQL